MTPNSHLSTLRVALAHDYLIKNGGAEKVLQSLHKLFPQAPVYTLVYNEQTTDGLYKDWDIRTSYLQNRPLIDKGIDYYRALMPMAVESFDFSDYDLVISDVSSFIKGVLTGTHTLHISYIHTPTRFLWFDIASHIKRGRFAGVTKAFIPYVLHKIRQWDVLAAERPDFLIANSVTTKKRIAKFYRRESTVIYPPVAIEQFEPAKRSPQDFFLIMSRLEPHKDIDTAIKAANQSKVPLVIAGTGGDLERLKKLAGPTVKFVGQVSDQERNQLFYTAKAYVAPQREDFGITFVEALAAGCPVIARNIGGAQEIVKPPKNGILLDEITEDNLSNTFSHFSNHHFNPTDCADSVTGFSEANFEHQIKHFIEQRLNERK